MKELLCILFLLVYHQGLKNYFPVSSDASHVASCDKPTLCLPFDLPPASYVKGGEGVFIYVTIYIKLPHEKIMRFIFTLYNFSNVLSIDYKYRSLPPKLRNILTCACLRLGIIAKWKSYSHVLFHFFQVI